jgi:hypothetical protein
MMHLMQHQVKLTNGHGHSTEAIINHMPGCRAVFPYHHRGRRRRGPTEAIGGELRRLLGMHTE